MILNGMIDRKFRIILFLLFSNVFVGAQPSNIGIPFIGEYPKKQYQAGTQTWDIVQNEAGVVFFANNSGMLQFDGKKWRCFPLPNKTIVRSLAIDPSGFIYAGGQNEMGFFKPDEVGNWTFTSLKGLIGPEYNNFEDVWNIIVHDSGVFFLTNKYLFHYHNETITAYQSQSRFVFLGLLGDQLILQDTGLGLSLFNGQEFEYVPGSDRFQDGPLTGILPLASGKWLITTLYNDLYIFDGEAFSYWIPEASGFLKNNRIYSAAIFEDGRIALGTAQSGLLIYSSEGKLLYHLNRDEGLLNNIILSLLVDKDQHLWLGLDNGINYVLASSPFTQLFPDGKAQGAGYDVQVFGDSIYFATANGLFSAHWKSHYSPFKPEKFHQVVGTKGQAWGLDTFNNDLLLSHHSGSFLIGAAGAQKNYPEWGVWLFRRPKKNPELLLAGTYTGIAVYHQQNGHWTFRNKIDGFGESSRFLEEDHQGNLWVAHPYKGIFKVIPNEDFTTAVVTKYGAESGLASNILNHVFKINEQLVFCSEKGVFAYDAASDRFLPDTVFHQFFGENTGVRRLFKGKGEDIWYITEHEIGMLKVQDKVLMKEISKSALPTYIRDQLVDQFELVYPIDKNNVFIGTETGFIHFDPQGRSLAGSSFYGILNEITFTSEGDSIISRGIFYDGENVAFRQPAGKIPKFPHAMNAFRFEFSATDFTKPEALKFQFYLEGLEKDWSDWTSKSEKEYTNLSAGRYTFHLRALNALEQPSEELCYQFEISPPWYYSPGAKVFLCSCQPGLALFAVKISTAEILLPERKSRSV
jgi:hypothetical protein